MSSYLAAECLPSFELELGERGDEGSSFRTQNDVSDPLQRSNITERKGVIDIRCTGADVIHGYLQNGKAPATLLVYEFQFDPRKISRRITTVDMEFRFGSEFGKEPEVLKVSPKGRMTLVPTTQTETTTVGGDTKAGGNVFGAEFGSSWKWEKVISRESRDATTIVGSMDIQGRNYGPSNAVSWTIMENASEGTGVPAHVRTAVLLSRGDDEELFYSMFKIKAQVDLVSKFTRLFGSTPRDDPILYDTTLPPTNNLREYDLNSLGDVDMLELSTMGFTNDSQVSN
ncbi:hypothetical protein INS49_014774 [Diaporthe citri]|uniref:uncharacterized protein n=1 Tax=Diaporthe citri TaxID=83186 RepID=UPI001C80DF6B|nr:uncharacterized protein INS49_014774 [Diaporthe citri]KAG6356899.1 hypothetical protein INS49_014774 [Diaporthe citri]